MTEDHADTVNTYVRTREAVQAKLNKLTTYHIIRVGGQSVAAFEAVGVKTHDALIWSRAKFGYAVDVEKETEEIERKLFFKNLKALDEGTEKDLNHFRPFCQLLEFIDTPEKIKKVLSLAQAK